MCKATAIASAQKQHQPPPQSEAGTGTTRCQMDSHLRSLEDAAGLTDSALASPSPTMAAARNQARMSASRATPSHRAETAMVVLLRRHLATQAEARALVRELLVSAADIEPDDAAQTLTIRVHRMAKPSHD